MLVNRVHEPFGSAELTAADIRRLDAAAAVGSSSRSLSERVDAALQDARALAAADAAALTLLNQISQPRLYVPHFNRDLHSLDDLAAFADRLR